MITEIKTGIAHLVQIEPVEEVDFKAITAKRHWFNWRKEKNFSIWKLRRDGSNDIIGLMSLEYIDSEQRVHIRLLACSKENVGTNKIYSGIARSLIAYACRQAVLRYSDLASVTLIPKSKLRKYYITEYGMNLAGKNLCLKDDSLLRMIQL